MYLSNPSSPSRRSLNYNPSHTHYRRAHDDPSRLQRRSSDDVVDPNFSWNYDTVSQLWEGLGWIDSDTASEAKTHYGGYSVVNYQWGGNGKLKVISLNADFW
jgi:hypothetical protein